VLLAGSCACALYACGGSVTGTPSGAGGGSGVDASGGTAGQVAEDAGQRDASRPRPDASRDSAVPPECGDVRSPPQANWECDAFTQSGCASDEACQPFVAYPSGPCDFERYGTSCVAAGKGTQGDPCGNFEDSCARGYVCVKTGQGVQCIGLCSLQGAARCRPGLLCQPIDVEGFGGCF
jgi:hypothetical protein